jgi:hypothetical protein
MNAASPPEGVIKNKGKGKKVESAERTEEEERERWASSPFRRRQSLMGKELERTKHIVVDVGPPDAPRLVSLSEKSVDMDMKLIGVRFPVLLLLKALSGTVLSSCHATSLAEQPTNHLSIVRIQSKTSSSLMRRPRSCCLSGNG